YYFCLHRSDALRDLHSFPTRRSSDLRFLSSVALATLKGQYGGKATSGRIPKQHRLGKTAVWLATGPQPDYSGHFAIGITIDIVRDRKSTRLNSSHRTISYAVFCLKKK